MAKVKTESVGLRRLSIKRQALFLLRQIFGKSKDLPEFVLTWQQISAKIIKKEKSAEIYGLYPVFK
ncbi:MAG: hypothetical protein SPL86_03550 [Succiniclasticum sp.]|uniref:hypothetical protein n=1 Tax=Succiniclasticum sp. TaxID=2775030 RepID=UPI002A90F9E8|nr:hypothetical protein [Succiniclasticum sp.]MBR1494708.1 hypothetical protein [Acidaminococcaceae bacterium]MDY6290538.1 hypothetical protein [Succiniclasticum sp.]